jgi:tRNA pseudouridine55 synthase
MNGVLLIDKPSGPTSHDVVARIRRATGQRDIGHTGTLDPMATGLLPLVLGRATRLASVLTAGDKTYEAAVRLGFATETDDEEGQPIGEPCERLPADDAIAGAVNQFRGTFEQIPPAHSAKKIGGERAYELARRSATVVLKAVTVSVRDIEVLGREGPIVRVRITAASGFYVRALARDLGARLGCGGHLAALRRTHHGPFAVADAAPLAEAERLGGALASRLIAPADALRHLDAVRVTATGLQRALHGNAIGPEHLDGQGVTVLTGTRPIRVLSADGRLVALAERRAGSLHPVVVLG